MNPVCPNCKSEDVTKKGFRYNHHTKKQKYQCYDCKKWFVEDDGFKRMRFNPKTISRAVHMYNDGLSLFKTQYHLYQHDNVKVTRWTISQWDKKYSNFLKSTPSRSKAKAKRKTTS